MVTPFVGRDVAQLQLDAPMGLQREVYEPGQDIVTEGDLGQRLYVIQSGSAEVLRRSGSDDDGFARLATLVPGDHFGEVSVFEGTRRSATVRATSRVEVLSLGRELARSLSDVSAPIGEHLRQRPVGHDGPPVLEVDAP